jgi:hypothetical protein
MNHQIDRPYHARKYDDQQRREIEARGLFDWDDGQRRW